MRLTKATYLLIITALLAVYYLYCGIYINKLGYFNAEELFYIEKAKIIFDGGAFKLKVIGLTSPLFPFYATFTFSAFSLLLAPVIASAIGTALLFYLIASTLIKRTGDDFFLLVLMLLFLLHPGILFMACSGKGIYLTLIFVFLFYLNIFKYYTSNTTFHVSIASICLVILVFCDYKFIWLSLFFLPLIFSIAVNSLNLAEKESIFRISISFNNPSLRRKLINKTFAIYVILFILPIASIICYKLLNLTNANDLNYFLESPYANWSVLSDRLNYELLSLNQDFKSPDVSLIISAKVLIICPLMLLAIYLFRDSNYQILTVITPFAFIEFLHIKYEKVAIAYEYYLMFIVLSFLCISVKAQTIKNRNILRLVVAVAVLFELFSGYYYIKNSPVAEEKKFITTLTDRVKDPQQDENKQMANYLNGLPNNSKILVDDGIAYPVVAFTDRVKNLTLPYQEAFLSAIETPWNYDNYILIATNANTVNAYSILNQRYGPVLDNINNLKLQKVYETQNWALYKLFE